MDNNKKFLLKKGLLVIFLFFILSFLVFQNIILKIELNNNKIINNNIILKKPIRDFIECNYKKSDIVMSKQIVDYIQDEDRVCIYDVEIRNSEGESMNPTLGKSLLISEYNGGELNVGDIITFTYEGDKIAHRIISINGNEIITKGDNNWASDYKITKKDVRGIVKCSCYN